MCIRDSHYSEEELERFAALLKQANENLASRGMKLVFYMVPNKEQVYSCLLYTSRCV